MSEPITQTILAAAHACGVTLDGYQLHVGGERAVMSPHKYVFTGTCTSDGSRAVLKCADHPIGIAEMYSEHVIMETLRSLPFSEDSLTLPKELWYGTRDGYTIGITEFIEQSMVFPGHTLPAQFFMALRALESQEAFHTTTLEHRTSIRQAFAIHSPEYYQQATKAFASDIGAQFDQYRELLESSVSELTKNQALLQIYDGYLMHTDFVPHNFRIANDRIYLLDFSSFRLGNKYESWARFLNFMEIHSPDLVPLLCDYVAQDRGVEESAVLRLMRLHKALFLVQFYCHTIQKTTGDLQTLATKRAYLWLSLTQHIFDQTPVDRIMVDQYRLDRNALRTETEKVRQLEFTLL